MKACELKKLIEGGALAERYSALYLDTKRQSERFIKAIDAFCELYGDDRDIFIFSVPGRSEISGNHTDHNHGCVLAGAIDRDIIAVAARNNDGVIRFKSEGYNEDVVKLDAIDDPDNFPRYKSVSLIAGLAKGFKNAGYAIGGYDAYSTTEVLKGSGISSSAAFEVQIGNVLNYLYNDGRVSNIEIAKLAQFSENVYFGKPCGLMDQMACAVGGFVFIDFEDNSNPIVEPIEDPLANLGYSLCIVNTGGNHADLNDDYASVPYEMKAVAKEFGKDFLRGLTEDDIIARAPALRETVGDRAILRAIHFIRENDRVCKIRECLKAKDVDGFFRGVIRSGLSSFRFLQNVFTTINVREQGLSLALAITEGYLDGAGAYRVHGGGFAGTIQAFVPNELADGYVALMNSVFGEGAVMKLRIRQTGATRLF
ncbi:MAG: galactokinase [Clostridia bacterium]|nr:galactokinase [Clostridia bacterium]MBQ8289435.1 galactokinase [Clostridia bacterium]